MKLRLHHLAYVMLLIAAGGVVQVVVWELWPRAVFKFNKPLEVHTYGTERTGVVQYLDVVMDYCKYTNIEAADVYIAFEDDLHFDVPGSFLSVLELGCHVSHQLVWMPALPSGMYRVVMFRVYHVNPVRNYTAAERSNAFRVEGTKDRVDELETKIDRLQDRVQESIDKAWAEVRKERQRSFDKDHAGNVK